MYTIAFSVLIAFPVCVICVLALKAGKFSSTQDSDSVYTLQPIKPAALTPADGRVAELEATLAHLRKRGKRAVAERDIAIAERERWQKRALQAERNLVQAQAEAQAKDSAPSTGTGKKYDQHKRFIAREFHPDLSSRAGADTLSRTEMFTILWTKVEEIDKA